MINKMTNLIADILQEENILEGMTQKEVKWYFDRDPDIVNDQEWIYIIERYFCGLLTKKIHLYFHKGKLRDYYIGIF